LAVPPLPAESVSEDFGGTGSSLADNSLQKTAKTASLVIRTMDRPLGVCIRVGAFGGGAYMHAV
jgi:hypothetical protein